MTNETREFRLTNGHPSLSSSHTSNTTHTLPTDRTQSAISQPCSSKYCLTCFKSPVHLPDFPRMGPSPFSLPNQLPLVPRIVLLIWQSAPSYKNRLLHEACPTPLFLFAWSCAYVLNLRVAIQNSIQRTGLDDRSCAFQ